MSMECISIFLAFATLFLCSSKVSTDQTSNSSRVYIVYMGSAAPNSLTSTTASLRTDHARLLTLLTRRHGFSGFAARLSEEALLMAQKPGVVSVFPDHLLKLHTTHSWDFLEYQTELEIDSFPNSISENNDAAGDDTPPDSKGFDTIIGILDTGIWPESESFNDKGMGPIPSRWKGTCMKGPDFTSSSCNRKLIGARFYYSNELIADNNSPRDLVGHGTHVAGTAAGSVVPGASYYGLAAGTAKGGSPGSRIAMYKVCTAQGCYASAILAAFDDAISDGVDVLSVSLGSTSCQPDLSSDPIAMGAFHAVERGIIVVSSAGNDGPNRETVANFAPWLLIVSASTIDRNFQSNVILGGNKVIQGEGINFSRLQKSPVHPLIYALSAKTADSEEPEARNCDKGSLEEKLIKGKIVICDTDVPFYTTENKIETAKSLGGLGVVFTRDDHIGIMADTWSISSNSHQFKGCQRYLLLYQLNQPDIAAPGVDILAAWIGNDTAVTLAGKEAPTFNVLSGTSMACPHVSGIAASVKTRNRAWSPSAIRSAIMTTGFACPKDSKADYISNINYPSIAISKFNGKESRNISRKVTNVAGDGEMVFTANVDAPRGLSVKVIPDKLIFSKNNQKLSYQVVFSATTPVPKEDMFGSLTWSNGQYKVRSPFVVSI
ncbi:hypothetical protein ACLB2K_017981 [Fragaria x ananassa]